MPKNSISNQALKEIKEKKIKPKPRWEFTLKNILFGAAFILSIMIGSIATSVMIYMIRNNDWDLRKFVHPSFLGFVFITLPYIWIIFFVIFLAIAYINFRNLKVGYKYRFLFIITASILISIILGTVFYYTGLGRTIEDTFREKLPIYRNIMQQKDKIWLQPEKGILIGKIIDIDKNNINIIDLRGNKWVVDIKDMPKKFTNKLKNGMPIKILGKKSDENNFKAVAIRIIPGKFYPILYEMIEIESQIEIPIYSEDNYFERKYFEMRTS